MIVARVADPLLRGAVCAAAHPEEDVVTDGPLAELALQVGAPRLAVHGPETPRIRSYGGVRLVELDELTLKRWEVDRRSGEVPERKREYLTRRLRTLLDRSGCEATWVDLTLANLSRAAGAPLPPTLRAFARRVLEFPAHYSTLHAVSDTCDLTRGALKARFRRRGLASPYTYLRWFRTFAVAEALADASVPVAQVAFRLGFSSAGNLCRTTATITKAMPSELRTARGRNGLLIKFAWQHLTPTALQAWSELDGLFDRQAA